MPFTFAHPAFALPLRRIDPRRFSATGLALGSMAPDFEYFLALEPYRTIGHTFAGFLLQAVPLCILFGYLFHALVKVPLALHLPSVFGLDRRAYGLLRPWRLRTVREWIVYLLSVAVGFLSHVAVDALTHRGGYFVRHAALLRADVFVGLPVYKLLQYGLSLFGLAAVFGAVVFALCRSTPPSDSLPHVPPSRKLAYWGIVAAVAAAMTGSKLLLAPGGNIVGMLVVAPIAGCGAGVLLASWIWRQSSI